jgi:hypothetical protein
MEILHYVFRKILVLNSVYFPRQHLALDALIILHFVFCGEKFYLYNVFILQFDR